MSDPKPTSTTHATAAPSTGASAVEVRRRRPGRTAVIAWAGAGVVCASLVIALNLHAASPTSSADELDAIPSDLGWSFFESCMSEVPIHDQVTSAMLLGYYPGADGVLEVELGSYSTDIEVGEGGGEWTMGEPIVDAEVTASVNACLAERRVEYRSEFRLPTAGERLLLHDWVRRYEQPCLASHGLDIPAPSYRELMDEDMYPWYLLDMVGDLAFEKRLGIRLACEPIPAFLRADGVGW